MSEPTNNVEPFDLESVYDQEIAPLMTQIIEVCARVKMPMLASFCYGYSPGNPDKETEYCTTLLNRDGWQTPEFIESANIILNGASTRPKLAAFTVSNTEIKRVL